MLDLLHSIPTHHDIVPRDIAATSDSIVWLLFDSNRQIEAASLSRPLRPVGSSTDTGFILVTSLRDTLFAARKDGIFRWNRDRNRFDRLYIHLPMKDGISSFAVDERNFWIVSWDGKHAALMRIARARKRKSSSLIDTSIALPDAATVERQWNGCVLVTLLRAPHTLSLYDSSLRKVWNAGPSGSTAERTNALPSGATSMATLPLDHRKMLQVITDLRSEARWLFIYSESTHVSERSRRIQAPVGFLDALEAQHLLIGYTDSSLGGEIVLYRWKWQ